MLQASVQGIGNWFADPLGCGEQEQGEESFHQQNWSLSLTSG